MSGIDPDQLRSQVIKPTLAVLDLGGEPAEELLLGTAAQESSCGAYLAQVGGPALGIWQMEPATHDDIWANYLAYRQELSGKISSLLFPGLPRLEQLAGNLFYSCAMARIQYLRTPTSLPPVGDLEGQAQMYKACYNTAGGAASTDQYIVNAKRAGLGEGA